MHYFLDRFGEDLTKAVVASQANSIDGFNSALAKAGRPERFDDIFADWVIANYLNTRERGCAGRYRLQGYRPDKPKIDETHRRFPADGEGRREPVRRGLHPAERRRRREDRLHGPEVR